MSNPIPPQVAVVEADPAKPVKAIAATVLSFVSIFVGIWIADTDPFTAKEIAGGLVTAAIGSGITGVTTFTVPNPLRTKRVR